MLCAAYLRFHGSTLRMYDAERERQRGKGRSTRLEYAAITSIFKQHQELACMDTPGRPRPAEYRRYKAARVFYTQSAC